MYAKAEEINIQNPYKVFDSKHLQKYPCDFYRVANICPAKAHYFMKKFDTERKLRCIFTQNIDSLELETNIDPIRVVQAHGHAFCHMWKVLVDSKFTRV